MTAFGDRLKSLFATKGLSTYQAGAELGYGRTSKLYKLLGNEVEPSFPTMVDILRKWPDISADWLLLGEGPMTRAALEQAADEHPRQVQLILETPGENNVAHVPIRAQAGYANATDPSAIADELIAYSLPIFKRGVFVSFDVEGDSMQPTFSNHDIVICTQVRDFDLLRPGHCYVVVMHDNVLVKRILTQYRRGDEGMTLHSDNQAYAPYEVPAQDVKELWLVKACLTTNIPANEQQLHDRLVTVLEALGANYDQIKTFLEERLTAV